METCQICFEDYRIENTKDHQCPDIWSCGACGELCTIEEGTVSMNLNYIEFTHKAELCGAQDEIQDVKKDQTRYEYKLEVTFRTERRLTEEELGQLQAQCCVQVEEPTTHEGDDVTYTTSDICTDIRLLWSN